MAPEYWSFFSPFWYLALVSEKTAFASLYDLSFDEDAELDGETSFERSMSLLPFLGVDFFLMWSWKSASLPCAQQQQGGEPG